MSSDDAGVFAALPPPGPPDSPVRHSGFLIPHLKDHQIVAAAVLVFAAVSLALNVTSTGFLEADGITHYLYARWALAEPHLLTNVWGRPVVTLLHALPAQLQGTIMGQPLGLVGVRAVSMLLAIGSALIAWRVAAQQGPDYGHDRPGLAAIFMLCMPLVILHSIAELTELPFAFLAIAAVWAYQRRSWWALAVVAGLLPAARPEGFGFAALAMMGLLLHRRWLEALLVPLPLIVWDRSGWWQYGGNPGEWWQLFAWLGDNWPYSEQSAYASGPLLKFVGMLPAVVGPAIVPFVILGIVTILRGNARDHRVRVAWVIAIAPLLVLGAHSLLHWLGRMASSGDVRYLVCVAPFWALLAARGWDWLASNLRWRHNYLWATLAAVVPLLAIQIAYPVVPLTPDQPGRDAMRVAAWYQQSEYARTHPRLLSDHPIVWYVLDLNPQKSGGGRKRIGEAPAGAIFLWHDIYSVFNADERYVVLVGLPAQMGWRDVTPSDFPKEWRVFTTPTQSQ